jgi:hypothetical protein
MIRPFRAPFLLFLGALGASIPSSAFGGEKDVCVDASVQGQRARVAGQLTKALERFAVCAREVCPQVVRQDCAGWQDEVGKSLPTVSVGFRDPEGHDILDVKISVDGKVVTEHLDGKSFPVDPGTHVFRANDGVHPPVEERVLVKEGEKARAINLRLPSTATSGTSSTPTAEPKVADESGGGRSAIPFVLMGVGAVGAGVGLGLHFAGKGAFPDNCSEESRICQSIPEDPNSVSSTEKAQSAVNLRNAGTVVTFGSLAVALGGLVWFFLDSPSPKKTALVRPTPVVGQGFFGVSVGGGF